MFFIYLYVCVSACLSVRVCLPVCLFVFLSCGVFDCMWHVTQMALLTLFAVRMQIENHYLGFGQLMSSLYHLLFGHLLPKGMQNSKFFKFDCNLGAGIVNCGTCWLLCDLR